MLAIDTESKDPFFNLACEEYLFRNFKEELLIIYINRPSVIVGKHQNAYEEVNLKYIRDNNLPVIRRISGGGSVYHDEGNINFTFMRNREDGKQVSFIEHTRPIISFFEKHGLSPYVGGKNEIREDGLKFSGNAEHVFKNRLLHHGTILFSSDLSNLKNALRKGSGRYSSRAVQSNRTVVGNLSERLKGFKTAEELKISLEKYLSGNFYDTNRYSLSDNDKLLVQELIENKYSTEDWNYGYGPDYKFRNTFDYMDQSISLEMDIKGGIISTCIIEGSTGWEKTAGKLEGKKHLFSAISDIIQSDHPGISGDIIYNFFN
jgi:lipoate-protein ligase A